MKLSVIIPTLNAAHCLPQAIAALGAVGEIIVVDGGSRDGTVATAGTMNARLITSEPGRGAQLKAGAEAAVNEWLLFLHADTQLRDWREAAGAFIADPHNQEKAAVFGFALDDDSYQARRLEHWVDWRVRRLALPYGDQGLLIHRGLYRRLGGYRPTPLMEDVDLVRRIGRQRLVVLNARAITSAARWRKDGWLLRSTRNLTCLVLYFLGVSPHLLKRLYG